MTGLASPVGWAVAAVASLEASCDAAGLSTGARRTSGRARDLLSYYGWRPSIVCLTGEVPALPLVVQPGCGVASASGRPVEAEPGIIRIWTELWAPADDSWRREKSLNGLSRLPCNDQPWLPSVP